MAGVKGLSPYKVLLTLLLGLLGDEMKGLLFLTIGSWVQALVRGLGAGLGEIRQATSQPPPLSLPVGVPSPLF